MTYRRFRVVLTLKVLASVLVASAATAEPEIPADVFRAISSLVPGAQPESVKASPVSDLYEVVLGPHVIYVTGNGRFMLRGDLVEIDTQANLTEASRAHARLAAIEKVGESSMVIFSPEKSEHTITVFTDVDCGYCAKLHREVPELNRKGVKVRYLAFPRAGIKSRTYDKMVSVWCAEDSLQALSDAKFRRPLEPRTCENPVQEHYRLGKLVGVRGTPTIVLENGEVVPGYVPAGELVEMVRSGGDT